MIDQLTMDLPFIPVSLKNSARVGRGRHYRGDRGGGARPDHHIDVVRATAMDAVCRLKARGVRPKIFGSGSLWGDHDVGCTLIEFPRDHRCRLFLQDLGEKPSGKTGRRRDLGNVDALVHDALQGILYDDDRQLTRISSRRVLTDEVSPATTPHWDERTVDALKRLFDAVYAGDPLPALGNAGNVLRMRGMI